METLQWKNSITNIKSLPASTQLSVKVTLKYGFVPVDGDELDLDFKVSYSVQVILPNFFHLPFLQSPVF